MYLYCYQLLLIVIIIIYCYSGDRRIATVNFELYIFTYDQQHKTNNQQIIFSCANVWLCIKTVHFIRHEVVVLTICLK